MKDSADSWNWVRIMGQRRMREAEGEGVARVRIGSQKGESARGVSVVAGLSPRGVVQCVRLQPDTEMKRADGVLLGRFVTCSAGQCYRYLSWFGGDYWFTVVDGCIRLTSERTAVCTGAALMAEWMAAEADRILRKEDRNGREGK